MTKPNPRPVWLTYDQVKLLYGLNNRTLSRMLRRGDLLGFKTPQGWRIKDPGLKIRRSPERWSGDDVHILRGIEVAEILGVIPRAVRHMAEVGRLDYGIRPGKGKIRQKRAYSINDVRKMIKERMKMKGPGTRGAMVKWARERLAPPEHQEGEVTWGEMRLKLIAIDSSLQKVLNALEDVAIQYEQQKKVP